MASPLKIQVAVILIFGMGLVITLHAIGLLKPAEATLTLAFKPAQQLVYDLARRWGVGNWDGQRPSLAQLEKENQNLRDQVNNYLVENLRLKERVQAMEAVTEQLKFLDERGLLAKHATVIGRSSDQVSSTLLLNQGANQNIGVGMAVVIEDGILIGKISEVEPNTSKVQLLTTSGSKTSALILSEKEVQGIVEGQHGLSLKLGFVLQSETIRPNDVVVTSGEEEFIPKNLVLGTLSDVDHAPGELWQSATLQPSFQSKELNIVSIIEAQPTP